MKTRTTIQFFLFLTILSAGCQAQTDKQQVNKPLLIGGGCDGCELMYVGKPDKLSATDNSPAWTEGGQQLVLTGTVYHLDGRTPAKDIVIYYWHTNQHGVYPFRKDMDMRLKAHGYIRGWVKTDSNGHYRIQTIRPGSYPAESSPAHIHLAIKEPDLPNEYYTDEINFDDDPLLLPHIKKHPPENRGGSGIVRVLIQKGLQIAEHDIVLGLNIPNYPAKQTEGVSSGLPIGTDQPSFTPFHAYGPDKGTQTCPVCKYGRFHGIIYFVGNHPEWTDIRRWLIFLERESVQRQKYLKVYFVYGDENKERMQQRRISLEHLGNELGIRHMALTFVPSFKDKQTEVYLNQIDEEVANTFIIYKHRRIVDKYIGLKAIPAHFDLISKALERTKGPYFNLSELPFH